MNKPCTECKPMPWSFTFLPTGKIWHFNCEHGGWNVEQQFVYIQPMQMRIEGVEDCTTGPDTGWSNQYYEQPEKP